MTQHKVGKKYYGSIDLNVLENSHTQAFLFIKEHCERLTHENPKILEIGCAGGYFSEVLRDHGMYVHAVEPFSNEAKDNNRVDSFFSGTVEDFCINELDKYKNSFDVVLLGDVIEHLQNPKQILKNLSMFLNEDGVFVASVPNITHSGIQKMLSDGQWIYQKFGLLDSTHIRFFSWRSLRELFISIGFGIERSYSVCLSEDYVYPQSGGAKIIHYAMINAISNMLPNYIKKKNKTFISIYL